MNKELLEELREKYNSYVLLLEENKQKLENLQDEKEKYETNPIIKKYLELLVNIKSCENRIKIINENSIEDDIIKIFDEKTNSDDKNNSNVYIFKEYDYASDESICSYYQNIETKEIVRVKTIDVQEFESKNIIIRLKTEIINNNYLDFINSYSNMYNNLRKDYIVDYVIEGEEKAIQKALTKNKK